MLGIAAGYIAVGLAILAAIVVTEPDRPTTTSALAVIFGWALIVILLALSLHIMVAEYQINKTEESDT